MGARLITNSWRPTIECDSFQNQQVESLTSHGFAVKNTFIDEPPQWWENFPRRRAHSVPAKLRFNDEQQSQTPKTAICAHSISAPDACKGAHCQKPIDCSATLQRQVTTNSVSDVSTACSEADEYNPAVDDLHEMDSSSLNPLCEQFAHQIVELVERECGFLQIRGHRIHLEARKNKKQKRGVAATLRFFVQGLPWVKRAKWHQPLCWSVMPMLQRCSCAMQMQGGELYVHAR